MKVLKYTLLTILSIVLIFLVLGLFLPTEYSVERSVVIARPRPVVFPQVASLKSQQQWSPWADYDPDMKLSYTGQPGTVGETSAWSGNDEVGTGEQEIRAITPDKLVHNEVRFKEPFESVGQAYLRLSDEGSGTRVSWRMTGENPYPWNVMSLFMDMDAMIGKDFERGLSKLKLISEKNPQPAVAAN